MGKINAYAEAQRERDKGNLERANKIEQAIAEKNALMNRNKEMAGLAETQLVAPGAQPDLPVQPIDPELAPQNLADESVEMQMASQLTEARRLPTESEKIQQQMQETGSIQPFVEAITPVPKYDVEGNLLPADEETTGLLVKENLALGLQTQPQQIDFNYATGEEFMSQISGGTKNLSPYNAVSDVGLRLTDSLNAELTIPDVRQDPDGQDFLNLMTTLGLVDPDSQKFTRKAGNVIAMQLVESFIQEQNVKDKALLNNEDPANSHLNPGLLNLDFDEEAPLSYEQITPLMEGTLLNPEYQRTSLASGIVDKVSDNPNRIGDALAGFGGASTQLLTPKTKAYLDTVAWQAIQGLGFVKETTVNGKTFYEMSQDAITYYENTRPLMNDINPLKVILPQLTPSVESINITAANALGFNRIGNVSIKNIRARDDSVQMQVVDMIGKMGNRINPNNLSIFGHIVTNVLNYRYDGKRIILSKQNPLAERGSMVRTRSGKSFPAFYSNSPLAKTVGLDKSKWDKAFDNAINVEGKSEADAADQADAVMIMRAKVIAMDYEMAKNFSNKVFYYNAFYATSNGRFFYRQTVMNPQNNKWMRGLLANPKRNLIDLSKLDLTSDKMTKWAYNIGRAILPVSEYKSKTAKADRVGFNQVVNPTQKILSEGASNPIYRNWVNKGRIIAILAKHDMAIPLMDSALIEQYNELINELTDPEEWGLVSQAYLDVYNYDIAKKNKARQGSIQQLGTMQVGVKILPKSADNERVNQLKELLKAAEENNDAEAAELAKADIFKELQTYMVPFEDNRTTTFEATVLAKPDGKQSGPSIQAIQNRDISIAKRTGFIYQSQDNVIPEGDIRSLFFERFAEQSQSIFKTNDHKRGYWTDILSMMSQNPAEIDGLVKTLSRTPLMEYTYGKYEFFNQGHIMNFLRTPFGQRMMDAAKSSDIQGYAATENDPSGYRELVNDFNLIIGNSLLRTMDIEHQAFLQNLGLAWSMMASESARFKGPLGDTVYMGSRMRAKTGATINIPFARGRLGVDLTTSISTGSARPAKRNKAFNDITLKFSVADPLPYGKEVANQMPVLTVQVADAAVMANAIYRVNKPRGDAPAWGLFIHDSIISDSLSITDYMRAYNNSMKQLLVPGGKQFWSIAKETKEAFEEGLSRFKKKLESQQAKGETILLSNEENNKYRSMVDYLTRVNNYENKGDKEKRLLGRVISMGYQFNLKSQYLSPVQVFNIHKAVREYMELNSHWANWVRSQKSRDKEFTASLAEELMNLL